MTQLAALLRRVGGWRGSERSWAGRTVGSLGSLGSVGSFDAGEGASARLCRRTAAATGSPRVADALVGVWTQLGRPAQAAVGDPTLLAADARQADGTTCGSAVLTMLAAIGDPTLALWLATGRLVADDDAGPDGHRPPELLAAPSSALAMLADAPASRRFAAVQRVYRRRATAGALLGGPWPAALGTPPWGAARVARFPGVVYAHHPLDDGDRPALHAVLDGVGRAVDAGVPVPLYSGGDSARGWQTAVPRHAVLAVGREGDGLRVFEPACGRVVSASRVTLLGEAGPQQALGGWPHLVWALPPSTVPGLAGTRLAEHPVRGHDGTVPSEPNER